MIAPCAADFIDEWFIGMRIDRHIHDGKIGDDISVHQHGKGDGQKAKLQQRSRWRERNQRPLPGCQANKRGDALDR